MEIQHAAPLGPSWSCQIRLRGLRGPQGVLRAPLPGRANRAPEHVGALPRARRPPFWGLPGAPKPASAAVEASKRVLKTFSGRVRHALDHVRAFFGARSRPQCADAFRLARHRRCRRSCSPARALLRWRALAIWRSSCARLLSLRFEGAVEVSKGVLKCFQAAHCWYVARARQTRPLAPPLSPLEFR